MKETLSSTDVFERDFARRKKHSATNITPPSDS